MRDHVLAWIAVLGIGLLAGCDRLSFEYGDSRGVIGRTSLNGFGALRTAYERGGFRSRDVSRLSDRVRRTDVIVWTPKTASSIDSKTTEWFDLWLRQGGRTLVFVVPDSGSEAQYWLDTAKLAPPDQRLEYRKRASQAINQRMQWRMNRSTGSSNGWFQLNPLLQRRSARSLQGPWQAEFEAGQQASNREDASIPDDGPADPTRTDAINLAVEYQVIPYNSKQTTGSNNNPIPFNTKAIGPGITGLMMSVATEPTKTPVQFSPLLAIDEQVALIGQVRSPQWDDSKILVVASGSLLTNYAFADQANRRLADMIILESTPDSDAAADPSQEMVAGFLTTNAGSVPVSERTPGAPQNTGMEMLTEWPISVVTMHGLILGMVVCLMLLPIFGRPKKIRRVEPNHFGHHLDAVAALMKKAGGEHYARAKISEYMKRMHGETVGPWVLSDPQADTGKPSLSTAGEKRLPSSEAAIRPHDKPSPVVAASKPAAETDQNPNIEQDEEDR